MFINHLANLSTYLLISGVEYIISSINKLAHQGIPNIQQIAPKLVLTYQTLINYQ